MRLGTFHMPLHPATKPLVEVLSENSEKIIHADKLGYDEAWIGEHISCLTEPLASPLIFIASMLPQTKNIKFATGVVCLPNKHPAIVAAEVSMVDHMAQGRFIFGIGSGSLVSDMELFDNMDPKIRSEKTMEAMAVIRKIWTEDPPYDIQGKHWNIKLVNNVSADMGLGYIAKPFQKPYPPIALAAASPASGTVKFSAKQGWISVTANYVPESTVISHWDKYVEGCEAAGREPTGQDWSVARNVLVAESDAQAEDWAMSRDGSNYFYFDYVWKVCKRANMTASIKPDAAVPDDQVTVEDLVKAHVIYGSPSTVVSKIQSLRERSGPFGTLLMAALDGTGENQGRELASMRLLAEQVRPQFSR